MQAAEGQEHHNRIKSPQSTSFCSQSRPTSGILENGQRKASAKRAGKKMGKKQHEKQRVGFSETSLLFFLCEVTKKGRKCGVRKVFFGACAGLLRIGIQQGAGYDMKSKWWS